MLYTQEQIDDLAKRLQQDRVRRQMSWKKYAAFMGGMREATLYKIATGRARPHDTTVAKLLELLDRPDPEPSQQDRADEVVSR